MQDFPSLKLLDRFEKVFTRFGIDYRVMRKILQAKLVMDRRRVPTIFSQNNKKDKRDKNHYMLSLWIYVLFGLFLIPFTIMGDNYLFQMSLVFGLIIFFLMTSMISDFSSVLLDIRDRNILYPKPIDRKTISAAKLTHIVIYLSLMTIALTGPSIVAGLFRHGIVFFLIALLNVILIDLLIIALTALIYVIILQFFDGEKLKDLINYVQIGLSFSIMIGYQLLIRSFEIVDLSISLEPAWWHILVFPIWYGVIMELFLNGGSQPFYFLLAGLGIVVPFVSIWIYAKLTPSFERNLQKLSQHNKGRIKKRLKLGESFRKFICPTKEERVFYQFSSLMLKNEREFKLRVYPSLGFSIVIPFIFLFTFMDDFSLQSFNLIREGKSYLNIYFSLLMMPTVIITLKYSGTHKGAWVYKLTPLKNLKPIFSGTMKAFIVNLYMPIYFILCIVFIPIYGVRIIPDLILVFVSAMIYAVICFSILEKSLPFSRSFETYSSGNGAIIFMLMLVAGLFAGLHIISMLFPYGLYIYLALAVLTLLLLWRKVFNVSWEKVE
ncbi:hypothetical protein DZB84_13045 [Bacillus sp. HNG]|uniref:hypothetical protein n=1 Tax=Bacillus sp. HNG TaxID=2293325 RepID=UPI000E2EA22F|nr:hypothetical protein [Bacillus sp. HNG]RFB15324.1 hypothetical protein DZB84_13045 [Bacillus sp. HNG]